MKWLRDNESPVGRREGVPYLIKNPVMDGTNIRREKVAEGGHSPSETSGNSASDGGSSRRTPGGGGGSSRRTPGGGGGSSRRSPGGGGGSGVVRPVVAVEAIVVVHPVVAEVGVLPAAVRRDSGPRPIKAAHRLRHRSSRSVQSRM